jgi:hypothetical protein
MVLPAPAASPQGDDLSLVFEIVAQVALSVLTNLVNEVAQTVRSFVVQPRKTGCPEPSMLQVRRHQHISGDMP